MGPTGARGSADHGPGSRIECEIPAPTRQSVGELASHHRLRLHAGAPVFRFRYQVDATYANRLRLPSKGKLTKVNLKRGTVLAWNIVWRIGIVSDYRAAFWKAAWHALRRGQMKSIFGMGFVAWHLIQFTQRGLERPAKRILLHGEAILNRKLAGEPWAAHVASVRKFRPHRRKRI